MKTIGETIGKPKVNLSKIIGTPKETISKLKHHLRKKHRTAIGKPWGNHRKNREKPKGFLRKT